MTVFVSKFLIHHRAVIVGLCSRFVHTVCLACVRVCVRVCVCVSLCSKYCLLLLYCTKTTNTCYLYTSLRIDAINLFKIIYLLKYLWSYNITRV